jgi:site-specific recombinase XerD
VFLSERGRQCRPDTIGRKVTNHLEASKIKTNATHAWLRHTFRTVAVAAKDRDATRLVMGHADGEIDGHYIEAIEDDQLEAVAACVHAWLYPATQGKGGAA